VKHAQRAADMLAELATCRGQDCSYWAVFMLVVWARGLRVSSVLWVGERCAGTQAWRTGGVGC